MLIVSVLQSILVLLYLVYRVERLERLWIAERKELLNRLMSRNLGEYKYYEEKFPGDVKIVHKQMEDVGSEDTGVKEELSPRARKFLSDLDSQFSEDEIDRDELERRLAEEEKSDFSGPIVES